MIRLVVWTIAFMLVASPIAKAAEVDVTGQLHELRTILDLSQPKTFGDFYKAVKHNMPTEHQKNLEATFSDVFWSLKLSKMEFIGNNKILLTKGSKVITIEFSKDQGKMLRIDGITVPQYVLLQNRPQAIAAYVMEARKRQHSMMAWLAAQILPEAFATTMPPTYPGYPQQYPYVQQYPQYSWLGAYGYGGYGDPSYYRNLTYQSRGNYAYAPYVNGDFGVGFEGYDSIEDMQYGLLGNYMVGQYTGWSSYVGRNGVATGYYGTPQRNQYWYQQGTAGQRSISIW